jgi:hypothetical protein
VNLLTNPLSNDFVFKLSAENHEFLSILRKLKFEIVKLLADKPKVLIESLFYVLIEA